MIELRAWPCVLYLENAWLSARAGLVFDNPNIAPLGMLNQRESPPRKSMAW